MVTGEAHRVSDLELTDDVAFQQREWQVQRVGWVVIGLLIVAALLGATGSGVFARATGGDRDGPLQVEYGRFERLEAPATLVTHIATTGANGEVALWIDRAYLEGVQIEQITPQPTAVQSGMEGLVYRFVIDQPATPLTVTFALQHTNFGVKSGRLGLLDGPSTDLNQFVYP